MRRMYRGAIIRDLYERAKGKREWLPRSKEAKNGYKKKIKVDNYTKEAIEKVLNFLPSSF